LLSMNPVASDIPLLPSSTLRSGILVPLVWALKVLESGDKHLTLIIGQEYPVV